MTWRSAAPTRSTPFEIGSVGKALTGAGWLRTAARGRYVVPPERIVRLPAAIAAVQR